MVRSVLWGPVAWSNDASWVVATSLIGIGAFLLALRRVPWGAGVLLLGCLLEIVARPVVDDEPALLLAWLAAIVLLTEGAPHERAFLLRVNTTVVYAFAAASKVNPSWLAGEGVLGMAVADAVVGPSLSRVYPLTVVLVEALLAVGLWSRRSRAVVAVLGVTFHTGVLVTVSTALADVLFLVVLNFGLVASYLAFWHPLARRDVVLGPREGKARRGRHLGTSP